MKIDLLETQTQTFPLYDEALTAQIGVLVPDHNGYLRVEDETLNDEIAAAGGTYQQFEEEDGDEKFHVSY